MPMKMVQTPPPLSFPFELSTLNWVVVNTKIATCLIFNKYNGQRYPEKQREIRVLITKYTCFQYSNPTCNDNSFLNNSLDNPKQLYFYFIMYEITYI